MPYVGSPGLDADLEVAEAGWAAISTGWFLERAVTEAGGPDEEPLDCRPSPTRRAAITHRLARVTRSTDPRLELWRDLAGETLTAARAAWGDVDLQLAPAFRRRGRAG